MNYKADIYHNEGPGRFWEYNPDEDTLVFVHTTMLLADSPTEALEELFERYNIGESMDALRYRAKELRSLSVGDVVDLTTDGKTTRYACASVGWKEC